VGCCDGQGVGRVYQHRTLYPTYPCTSTQHLLNRILREQHCTSGSSSPLLPPPPSLASHATMMLGCRLGANRWFGHSTPIGKGEGAAAPPAYKPAAAPVPAGGAEDPLVWDRSDPGKRVCRAVCGAMASKRVCAASLLMRWRPYLLLPPFPF
jgi:hypothetical protein